MRLDSDILFPCYVNIQLVRQPGGERFVLVNCLLYLYRKLENMYTLIQGIHLEQVNKISFDGPTF